MRLRYDDRTHAYYQDGRRCKSISAVAKVPDDSYRLNLWKMRQVAVGLAREPLLLERVAAHVDDAQVLDALCEEATYVAGGNRAADLGTAAHRITETIDAGLPLLFTPLAQRVADQWRTLCERHGLIVYPHLIERIVGYPERKIWGRFDRLVGVEGDDALAVLDVKTGARALDYLHAHAIQLALYARADMMAAPIPGEGGETDSFEPLPPVRHDVAYVAHLPEDGEPRLVAVDIRAGWEAFERVVLPTFEWRARKGLGRTITPAGAAPSVAPGAPAGVAATATARAPAPAVAAPAAATAAGGAGAVGRAAPAPFIDEAGEADLRARVLAFVGRGDVYALALSTLWPKGVPGIKRPEQRHTAADVAAIEQAIEHARSTIEPEYRSPASIVSSGVDLDGGGVVPAVPTEPSADAAALDFGGERRRVFDAVRAAGTDGMTSHEIVAAGLVPNVNRCGTRLQELRGEARGWHGKGVIGHVLDPDGNPVLRANAAGNTAAVHVALDYEGALPAGYRLSRGPRPYTPPMPREAPVERPQIDEGGPADASAVKALGAAYRELRPDVRACIDRLTKQAAAAGASVSIQDKPTRRRFAIGRALLAWAAFDADDGAMETVLASVLDLDADRARWPETLAVYVGRLTTAQADALTDAFERLAGGAALFFRDDGRPVIGARP